MNLEILKLEIRLCTDMKILSIKKQAELSVLMDGIGFTKRKNYRHPNKNCYEQSCTCHVFCKSRDKACLVYKRN